jgi:O-antigen/teichoic acid export membrane protein
MSEKDEALQHLSEIKSVLVDKDSFFPYNYNALVVWGIIGMVMSLSMGYLLKSSIFYGSVFSFVMMSVGFMIESFLTKRVNKEYDIDDCTNRQKFISILFTMLTFFSIVISALLAKYELIIPTYIVWIFMCGVGYFSIGFVLNLKIFTNIAYLKMIVSLLLLIGSIFATDLNDINSMFFFLVQGVTFVLLGVLPILIGQKLKKEL